MAVGSLAWGFVAERTGDPLALAVAAGGLLLGVGTTLRWRLDGTERAALSTLHLLPTPELEDVPGLEEGPVLVTAEYRVQTKSAGDFVLAMRELSRVRLRDGAMRWGLFRDPAEQGCYLEALSSSHGRSTLRQLERATLADRAIAERARSFLVHGEQPTVTHLVAAWAPDGTGPITKGV